MEHGESSDSGERKTVKGLEEAGEGSSQGKRKRRIKHKKKHKKKSSRKRSRFVELWNYCSSSVKHLKKDACTGVHSGY